PIIGTVPYKGYFKKESAIKERKNLEEKKLDTHLRGVSAFSTLGWFEDPILSTMLNYTEEYFVSTLIHETVHANLYINGKSKFNEKVATFLGNLGAEAFYKKQKKDQDFRKKISEKSKDNLLFSKFITEENKKLKNWYIENKNNKNLLSLREKKFEDIKNRFASNILPKMKTESYKWISKRKLNNALLLLFGLYNSDFNELDKLADKKSRSFKETFKALKTLENSEDPEASLKKLIQ
ncbi:MAG: aminopeptidase, partial [Bdellovibrionales bacterium]|nr:aminopeptidase [Bdellovibrionales bacterium]NQZ19563.1 aminopeptidase [Bdellovibrionales bacterium]